MKKGFRIICFIIIGLYTILFAYALVEFLVDLIQGLIQGQKITGGDLITLVMDIPIILVMATPLIMFYYYTKKKSDSFLRVTAACTVLIFMFFGCTIWLGSLG